jgi:hypothetical protein
LNSRARIKLLGLLLLVGLSRQSFSSGIPRRCLLGLSAQNTDADGPSPLDASIEIEVERDVAIPEDVRKFRFGLVQKQIDTMKIDPVKAGELADKNKSLLKEAANLIREENLIAAKAKIESISISEANAKIVTTNVVNLYRMMGNSPEFIFHAILTELSREDAMCTLKEVRFPHFTLVGEDIWNPKFDHDSYAAKIRKADLRLRYEELGHFVQNLNMKAGRDFSVSQALAPGTPLRAEVTEDSNRIFTAEWNRQQHLLRRTIPEPDAEADIYASMIEEMGSQNVPLNYQTRTHHDARVSVDKHFDRKPAPSNEWWLTTP